MTTNEKAGLFLKSKIIAVVGLILKKPGPSNAVFEVLKKKNYSVFGVSKSLDSYKNEPTFPSLSNIPIVPDAVFLAINQTKVKSIVQECIQLGVKFIWMHDMMGTCVKKRNYASSVDEESVQLAEKNSIIVITGSCPLQILQTDVFHLCMNKMNQWIGRTK
jgi:predicted CoA-binding protein